MRFEIIGKGFGHMSILSLQFIGFAALLVLLYFAIPKKFQWLVLLAASAIFYASGGLEGCIYIVITIVSQYFIAIAIDKKNQKISELLKQEGLDSKQKREIKRAQSRPKKWLIALSVFINLGLLFFLKRVDAAIVSINGILGTTMKPLDLLIPIGLSYYTFKSIGYVIDVHRGRIPAQRNILKLALFIGYFPALVQGPIDRYEDLGDQLYAEHKFDYNRFCFGAQRMLWGYMQKLIIAERATIIINTIQYNFAANGYEGLLILFMMVLSSFRLYADFSGGMDIVLGLSEIFGITLTENFERPYLSHSVSEYWQRWHITLGAWMRNYVFYSLSLSSAFSKLGKKCREKLGNKYGKLVGPSIASFITFFLVGMWHGVGWAYVPFSIYNAALVASATLLEDVYAKGRTLLKVREESKAFEYFQIVRTFTLVTLSRYFILSKTPDMVGLIKATFASFNPWVFLDGTLYRLGLDRPNFILLVISIMVLVIVDVVRERGTHIRQTIANQNIILRWTIYYGAIFSLIIFGMYGPGYDASSFIYQRF